MLQMRLGFVAIALLLGAWWSADVAHRSLRAGAEGRTSDMKLQWVVARYARRAENPYEASLRAAQKTRRSQKLVTSPYQVIDPSLTVRNSSIPPDYRSPVATYPPFTVVTVAATLGWMPDWLVDPVWLAVNVIVILALPLLLQQFAPASSRLSSRIAGYVAVLALILVWPATSATLRWSQFGLLSVASVLFGVTQMNRRPLVSGASFALSLIKPSIALPFLVLPLVRRQWTALAVAIGLHVTATIMLATWVGEWPWVLLGQWLEVGRLYQQFGMYSLKEVIEAVGLLNGFWDDLMTASFLVAVGVWTWIHRDADELSILSFLSCASLLWTYHSRHDFVAFLIPAFYALRIYLTGEKIPKPRLEVVPVVTVLFLGLALLESIYGGELVWTQVLRWGGRVSLVVALVWTAVDMRRHQLVGNSIFGTFRVEPAASLSR